MLATDKPILAGHHTTTKYAYVLLRVLLLLVARCRAEMRDWCPSLVCQCPSLPFPPRTRYSRQASTFSDKYSKLLWTALINAQALSSLSHFLLRLLARKMGFDDVTQLPAPCSLL